MTDDLVEHVVWDDAGLKLRGDALYAEDFGWKWRIGTLNDLGVPDEFIPVTFSPTNP